MDCWNIRMLLPSSLGNATTQSVHQIFELILKVVTIVIEFINIRPCYFILYNHCQSFRFLGVYYIRKGIETASPRHQWYS